MSQSTEAIRQALARYKARELSSWHDLRAICTPENVAALLAERDAGWTNADIEWIERNSEIVAYQHATRIVESEIGGHGPAIDAVLLQIADRIHAEAVRTERKTKEAE